MKIYFAHPIADYGTPREEECIQRIEKAFPGADILNPNQPQHQAACDEIGMVYFEELVKKCDALVAVPFPDGEFGMGVWAEMQVMTRKGGQTFALRHDEVVPVSYRDIRPLSITQTRERIKK